jgi:nucleoid-associated protein YgaU
VARLDSGAPNARVEAQLNNHTDVSQAHQFFQVRADAGLPNINLTTSGTGESAALHQGATGAEQAVGKIAAGAEHAIGALAHAASEPISPLIQMIMKMPGLTGIMNSFFEFLGALLRGNLLDALNPAVWMEHAAGALDSVNSALQHFTISLDMLPANGPMLSFDGMNFNDPMGSMNFHMEAVKPAADSAANVGATIDQPDLDNAVFEKAGYSTTDYHQNSLLDWHKSEYQIAMGGEGVYRPTTGGYYQPTTTTTSTTATTTAPAQTAAPARPAHHAGGHGDGHAHAHHAKAHHETAHHEVAEHTQIADAQTGDAPAAGGDYTVERGDSLWEIARKQLGDSSRWHEIYNLNSDVIGSNPDLIHPGVTLKMPDGNAIADSYVVQPGDNLWNIARHHLGGGEHWSQIYQMNQDIIGANPNLIHPGQHLSLSGGGSETVASSQPAADTGSVAEASSPAPAFESAPATPAPAPHAMAQHVAPASSPATAAVAHHAPVADHTQVAATFPHSTPADAPHSVPHEHTAGGGALQAETPKVDSSAPATTAAAPHEFSHKAGVGGEETINSATHVPADNQMYQAPDGSLFYRKPN